MRLLQTPLNGVFEAATDPIRDRRGMLARLFCDSELVTAQAGRQIVQVNLSRTSKAGAIRGLHFQLPPHSEAKWVRCIRGRVWDVAVDLRRGSPTFLKWHAVDLSAENLAAIFIPEGCAHGFQVLEPDSELLYLHTAAYAPGHERGVRWNEPRVSIAWPLAVTDLSERDSGHPFLDPSYEGVSL